MRKQFFNSTVTVLVLFFVFLAYQPSTVLATTSCTVSSNNSNIPSAISSQIVLTVNNTGDQDITSLQIIISSLWTITSVSANGWDSDFSNEQTIEIINGHIAPGDSLGLTITAITLDVELYDSWSVSGSDGGNNADCGSISFFISPSNNPTSTPIPEPTSTTSSTIQSSSTSSPTSTPTVSTKTVIVTPTPLPRDTIAPVVRLLTKIEKQYVKAPEFAGFASDNKGVSSVEYSINNGKSWLPVDQITSPGKLTTNFNFTPTNLDDGNYEIKVRAQDINNNLGYSNTYTLVIDRIPPQVGPPLIFFGAQILTPTNENIIYLVPNLKVKLVVSAIGGPVKIDLESSGGNFALKRNFETNLWTGEVSFNQPGFYSIRSMAIDGADNLTEKDIINIRVLKAGQVNSRQGTLTVYTYVDSLKKFIVWDGRPFGESNPQQINKAGQYNLFLPTGRYFIKLKSPGFQTAKTNIFDLDQNQPINETFTQKKKPSLTLGPFIFSLPDFVESQLSYSQLFVKDEQPEIKSALVNLLLPAVDFYSQKAVVSSRSLIGKPTLITLINTWSPNSSSQINFLEVLSKNNQLKVVVVIPQESASIVNVFKKRGGYNLDIFADPDGKILEKFAVKSTPFHIFLDRKGTVKKVKIGLLTKDELIKFMLD